MNLADTVALKLGDATLTVPAEAAARAYVAQFLNPKAPIAVQLSLKLPRIGEPLEDGIYAGMVRGLDGQPDYPLIVGPEAPSALTYKGAVDFAEKYKPWRLMLRPEGWLCQASVPELFQKEWYWLGVPFEADDAHAWAQYFLNGNQYHYRKNDKFRVRLVRSVIVLTN